MEQLIKNNYFNLIAILESMADFNEQIKYKQDVPFVHVPYELIQQWIAEFRNHHTKPWFKNSYSIEQLIAFRDFDFDIYNLEEELPDVPEIFKNEKWILIRTKASRILAMLKK